MNRIEGFWSMLNGAFTESTFTLVRRISNYHGEFEYGWNMRHCPQPMLNGMLHSFVR